MKVRSFQVSPSLPKALEPLHELAMNVWFSWNWDAVRLFINLERGGEDRLEEKGREDSARPSLWERSYQNPIRFLGTIPQETLDAAAERKKYVAEVRRVQKDFADHLAQPGWFRKAHGDETGFTVAYFSCEFGLSECFPIYSGGLGLLSGDHLKSASDLGLPLVGVGLLYQRGYFQQYLNLDGWQQERYPENDWYRMPVVPLRDEKGEPLRIGLEVGGDVVRVRIWRSSVGRIPLYLLDSNLPENPPHARAITERLYGGDRDMRIRQEILLGIGGVRALAAAGVRPTVYHMNEGHSAFLALERIRALMEERDLKFEEAREIVFASNVFTTHTPVPAGNEHFDPELVRRYLKPIADRLGLGWSEFLALGQEEKGRSPTFCMTVLALRLAAFANGVAELHAATSRKMWRSLWPDLPVDEVPVVNVSNGIHTDSWLAHEFVDLFEKHGGRALLDSPDDPQAWDVLDRISDKDLWETHEKRREKLVLFARKRLRKQLEEHGADVTRLREAERALHPKALTIGFARRFASYKRAGLLFADPDRLAAILAPRRDETGRETTPGAQIIIAGKAHPDDQPGKEIIRSIVHFQSDPRFKGRLVFLENYDINVARYLVQGCDVWLNTPMRPLEASGTSGMKAVANGGLHLSTLDGWWADAYDAECGWSIGAGEVYAKDEERDYVEGEALYNLLQEEAVPIFFDRKEGIPGRWIEIMRASMRAFGPRFNTHRMVKEYAERFYLPAHRAFTRLSSSDGGPARALAAWRAKVERAWSGVRVTSALEAAEGERRAGDSVSVVARASLGSLGAEEVSAEVYCGAVDAQGWIERGRVVPMAFVSAERGEATFRATIPCRESGRHGFAVRVLPKHPDLVNRFTPLLLTWEVEEGG